jgi:hypothetical protein
MSVAELQNELAQLRAKVGEHFKEEVFLDLDDTFEGIIENSPCFTYGEEGICSVVGYVPGDDFHLYIWDTGETLQVEDQEVPIEKQIDFLWYLHREENQSS